MTPATKILLLRAAVPAAIFLAIGGYVLANGHPHEDAFILFIYSEMLANTGVISYYEGGPHAEGATDFLWMVMIAALVKLGITAGTAALVLNTAGVFLLAYLVQRVGKAFGDSQFAHWVLVLLIPIYTTTVAAYGGFSVALYSALIALLYLTAITAKGRMVLAIAPLGLVLGLFRPDGAIIGALTCLIALAFLNREERKTHLLSMAACGAIGIGYFLWRWNYFGEFLPLPLIVKSYSDDLLPGMRYNSSWAINWVSFVILASLAPLVLNEFGKNALKRYFAAGIAIAAFVLIGICYILLLGNFNSDFTLSDLNAWSKSNPLKTAIIVAPLILAGGIFVISESRNKAVALSLPVFIYITMIFFANQTQNIGFRFQAPVAVMAILGTAVVFHYLSEKTARINAKAGMITNAFILVLFIFSLAGQINHWSGIWVNIDYLARPNYIYFFPYHLAKYADKTTVSAMTEAGRFAYWMPGKKYDVVGLNTAYTATEGVSEAYLREIDPDIIFMHHDYSIPSLTCPDAADFCELSGAEFREFLIRDNTLNDATYSQSKFLVTTIIAKYLLDNADTYTIYAFKYDGNVYHHVYGLKNSGRISKQDFSGMAELSFSPAGRLSYWDMKKAQQQR